MIYTTTASYDFCTTSQSENTIVQILDKKLNIREAKFYVPFALPFPCAKWEI